MNQSTYNSLKSFIWGIANDCLVDVYDVGDYRKIILPMFVIRRFDAVLEPKHEAVIKAKKEFTKAGITELDAALAAVAEQAFVNKSDFTLTDLKSRTNQQQLKKDFIEYLDGFSENVQVIINKFHIRNEIDRLSEQDRLGLLIEKFVDPRINLSNRPVLNEDGSVKIEALDNHTMGTLFEEVIRMFNEETNVTDAGRHFTPRDIVELIADLAFIPVQDKIQSTTYRIYDGACGTGGMLTVGDEHIKKLAREQGKKVSIHLYGQENADETYAIARADMLVKGEGKESDQIRFGSTISDDKFAKEEFDFMLSNPPFGTPWKTDLKAWGIGKKDEISDTRFIINYDDKYSIVHKGDIAINGLNLNYDFISQRVASVNTNGIITSAYLTFTPRKIDEQRYLVYLFKGLDGIKLFHGLGTGLRQTLTSDEVLKLQIPVPPKPEQDKIVQFLDWKISEMNHFIHQKKKQIKLLEELKYTQIDQYITKGLNPSVSMKDSKVEWIGAIPEHWDVDHIKQHFKVKKRIAGKEGYDVLSITQQGIKKKDISSNEGQMAQSYANYQFVYPGDFAMNHMDLLTGYIDISKQFGVTSPDYRVFTLSDSEHCFAPFYLRVFQIGYKRRIFYKFGKGAANQGRWRLPITAFYDYAIQVPPIDEQREIARQCDEVEKQINEMISGINKEITLVEELRTKLISDVVTGQVDVRNVKIPAYETETDIIDSEEDSDEENQEESTE